MADARDASKPEQSRYLAERMPLLAVALLLLTETFMVLDIMV
jgi:hypothetical protein